MLTLALLVLPLLQPVSLDSITVERARILHGRLVVANFIVAKPSYTWKGRTVLGAADRDDGAERGAVLKGNRLDIAEGSRVTIVGKLRVLEHPASFVGRVFVPAWTEIRIEQSDSISVAIA